jgi:hypothetical protein
MQKGASFSLRFVLQSDYPSAMNYKKCSICAAGAAVTEAVNAQLAQKVFLRDIAAAVGVSKSAVHRHSKKCVSRAVLNNYRDKKAAVAHGRMLLIYENTVGENQRQTGVYFLWEGVGESGAPITDVRPEDSAMVVQYAPLLKPAADPPPTKENSNGTAQANG